MPIIEGMSHSENNPGLVTYTVVKIDMYGNETAYPGWETLEEAKAFKREVDEWGAYIKTIV